MTRKGRPCAGTNAHLMSQLWMQERARGGRPRLRSWPALPGRYLPPPRLAARVLAAAHGNTRRAHSGGRPSRLSGWDRPPCPGRHLKYVFVLRRREAQPEPSASAAAPARCRAPLLPFPIAFESFGWNAAGRRCTSGRNSSECLVLLITLLCVVRARVMPQFRDLLVLRNLIDLFFIFLRICA